MNSHSVELEEQLRSLSPAGLQIERDHLIYSAGAYVASRQAQRIRRIWQTSTAAVSLLCVGILGVMLAQSGTNNDLDTVASRPQAAPDAEADPQSAVDNSKALSWDPNSRKRPETWSFSSIHNVNSWSREELEKRGIFLGSWKHTLQTEDPALDWIQVSFDGAHLPKGQDVVMTAWFISDRAVTESASRAARGTSEKDTVRLAFTVNDNHRANSYVDIFIWKESADGGHEAYGYKLSMKRIIELVSDDVGGDDETSHASP